MMTLTATPAMTGRRAAGAGLVRKISLWASAARERRALDEMNFAQLDDIGVDPKAAAREAHRPFWSVRRRG